MGRGALALVFGGAAALLGAAPALAGPPAVSVNNPANGVTLSTSSPQITGTVSATSTGGAITGSLSLTVTSTAGHPGWGASDASWCGQSSCSFTVPVSPGLAYNGQYQLTVSAQETDPPLATNRTASWSGNFSLAVPPSDPKSVSATPASDGSSVTVSWASNPEPDIVGYQVNRSPSSPGSWPQAVTKTTTDLVDSSVTPGQTYTYSVTAVRQGATSDAVLYSSPSAASATDPTVTDAGPGSGGSGSGSSGPGSGGSGSSGSGSAGTGSGSGAGSGSGSAGSSGLGTTGSGHSSGSGSSAGSSGSGGSGSSSGQPSLGTYGKASSSSSGGSQNLSSFDQLVQKTAAQQSAAGSTSASGVDGAPLPPLASGVAPGSDNPEVAPFSSGSSETQPVAGGSTTVSYSTQVENHNAVVRDFAAVGLAALLLAVVAHLLWLRRAASAAQ